LGVSLPAFSCFTRSVDKSYCNIAEIIPSTFPPINNKKREKKEEKTKKKKIKKKNTKEEEEMCCDDGPYNFSR